MKLFNYFTKYRVLWGKFKIKILLIYPPTDTFFIEKERVHTGFAPPMGLLYIAKILEENNHEVELIDFSAEQFTEEKLKNKLNDVEMVGLTVLSVSIKQTKEIISKIKQYNKKIKIIIGGPHCTLFPDKSLIETGADISVTGPGEKSILEIIKSIDDLKNVPGVYFKENKKIKKGKEQIIVKNIDDISFPSRHLVTDYNYGIGYNPSFKKGEFTSIITSRGCPFSCRFCSRGSISMKSYQTRSTKSIIKELREIKDMGFRYVAFVDDCFLANKKQSMEIFTQVIKEKINIRFYIAAARVDSADEKLYSIMKKAGVVFIQFGLESANQDVLDFYDKKTTPEKIKYAVELSNKMGFYTVGSFILGAPFETEKHFRKTIDFAKKLPLVSVSFVPLKYMAGSDIWYDAVKDKLISDDEYVVAAGKDRKLGNFTSDELIMWGNMAHREFVFRLGFFINFLKVSFKQSDFSFILSYVSFYLSSMFSTKNK